MLGALLGDKNLWYFLFYGGLFGLVILVAAVEAIVEYPAERRRLRAHRAAARAAHDRVAAQLVEVTEAQDDLKREAGGTSARLDDATRSALSDDLARVDARCDEFSRAWIAYDLPSYDPGRKQDDEGCDRIIAAMGELGRLGAAVQAEIDAVRARVRTLASIESQLAGELETVRQSIEQAEAASSAAAGRGFRVGKADELVRQAHDELEAAVHALQARRVEAAKESADRARELARTAQTWCDELPQLRVRLAADAEALDLRLARVGGQAAEARRTLSGIRADYGDACAAAAEAAEDDLDRQIDAARSDRAAAAAALTMEAQSWDEGSAALARAANALDVAERLVAGIAEQRESLDAAKQRAPELAAAAADSLSRAHAFAVEHAARLPSTTAQQIATLASGLAPATALLDGPQPRYDLAVARIDELRKAVESTLAEAQQRVEELSRLEAQTGELEAAAAAAVAKTDAIFEHERGRVAYDSVALLDDAQTSLRRARQLLIPEGDERIAGLRRKTALLEEARSRAEQALERAALLPAPDGAA